MHPKAMKQSKEITKNDWQTPPWLFERLNEIFAFEIDGASDGSNNLLPKYHTHEIDYHTLSYNIENRRIFINPPFNDILPFFRVDPRHSKLQCFLLPFRPETKNWHTYVWPWYSNIFIFNKRIQYIHPETKKEVKGAAFPSCLVFYGDLAGYRTDKLKDLGVFIKEIPCHF